MKTLFKTILIVFLFTVVISCKKKEPVVNENYNTADSTEAAIDTVGPYSDSTNTDTNGTTGATGEGSTGSGSAGTTQKGNTNIKKDSVSNPKGR